MKDHMTKEERINMIDAIYIKLTTGPDKQWSLGIRWLKDLSDEELKAKYDEVCK